MNDSTLPSTGKKPLHVLHVLTDTNVGGAGTLLCNLLANADPAAVSYSVLLPAGSRLVARLSRPAYACRVYTYAGRGDRSLSLADVLTIRRAIRALHPDILHTHAALSARLAGRLLFGRERPLVCTTHHCVFPLQPWQKRRVFRVLYRWESRLLSDGIIAVAQAAKDELIEKGLRPEDVRVIVNGVSPLRVCDEAQRRAAAERYGVSEGDFVVGVPARLESYKGQETVLRAAAICRAETSRIRFLFAGDGSQRARYEALARELGLSDCVRFCGFVEDMAPLYALMDIDLNASVDTETASLALSEGMSLGIPAVASDAGGNPYMVRPGVNGELFPAGDEKALAALLLRLSLDPATCALLGKGAKERFRKELNAPRMARETEAYYRELYEKSSRRARV